MAFEFRHTNEELRVMRAYPFDVKISLSKAWIREWYHEFGGEVYVSFSGGKDSTVLLDLVRSLYADVPAVFVDTGLEYPGIRENVKRFDNVVWLRPEKNFRRVVLEDGYPFPSKVNARIISCAQNGSKESIKYCYGENGKKSRFNVPKKWRNLVYSEYRFSAKCCDIMKKKPLKKYAKETGRKAIVGMLTEESRNRELMWLRNGCNAFNAIEQKSMPLSFWTEQDILQYLKERNLPIAAEYGEIKQDGNGKYYTTGVSRTGCMFCMFGLANEKSPNRFEQMRVNYPKQYEYCMKPVSEGGLGMGKLIDYLGLKR